MLFCPKCQQLEATTPQRSDDGAVTYICKKCGSVIPLRRDLKPGEVVAGFVIEGELGRGAMGIVYQARQTNLDREVAIKILSDDSASDEVYVERFFREARAAASLSHPNVVQAYDAGVTSDGIYYFVMEKVTGENLDLVLNNVGPLSIPQALDVFLSVANALSYAWARNQLSHGDIKPENIIMRLNGKIKLADFGLARKAKDPELAEEDIRATPAYAPPEIIRGDKGVPGFKSDMYSFGATAYHILCGHEPFIDSDPFKVCDMQISDVQTPLTEINPNIPQRLSDLVDTLMEKDPAKRPPSWDDVIAELNIISDELKSAPDPAAYRKKHVFFGPAFRNWVMKKLKPTKTDIVELIILVLLIMGCAVIARRQNLDLKTDLFSGSEKAHPSSSVNSNPAQDVRGTEVRPVRDRAYYAERWKEIRKNLNPSKPSSSDLRRLQDFLAEAGSMAPTEAVKMLEKLQSSPSDRQSDRNAVSQSRLKGFVGLGSWRTKVVYKDFKVTQGSKTLAAPDFKNGLGDVRPVRGSWRVSGGELTQTSLERNTLVVVGTSDWEDYTITVKAKKLEGFEGFIIGFAMPDTATESWLNLGGWDNTEHAIEHPNIPEHRIPGVIEAGKWYDIRIDVKPTTVMCRLDGKVIFSEKVKSTSSTANSSRALDDAQIRIGETDRQIDPETNRLNEQQMRAAAASDIARLLEQADSFRPASVKGMDYDQVDSMYQACQSKYKELVRLDDALSGSIFKPEQKKRIEAYLRKLADIQLSLALGGDGSDKGGKTTATSAASSGSQDNPAAGTKPSKVTDKQLQFYQRILGRLPDTIANEAEQTTVIRMLGDLLEDSTFQDEELRKNCIDIRNFLQLNQKPFLPFLTANKTVLRGMTLFPNNYPDAIVEEIGNNIIHLGVLAVSNTGAGKRVRVGVPWVQLRKEEGEDRIVVTLVNSSQLAKLSQSFREYLFVRALFLGVDQDMLIKRFNRASGLSKEKMNELSRIAAFFLSPEEEEED